MNEYAQLAEKVEQADAIIVGACNGFSITEGINLFASNRAFFDLFEDIATPYGISSIIQGMIAPWPTEEEKWTFWSRLVHHYCALYKTTSLMDDLQAVIGAKDHFILTTNGECHFEMAGFDKRHIFEVEGTWLEMQCAARCHDQLYPSFELTEQMVAAASGGLVPHRLVPRCPQCGGPMSIHMALDRSFIPNVAGRDLWLAFLAAHHNQKVVILELGVGPRNGLVKVPLVRLAAQEPNVTYATFNLSDISIPKEIAAKSLGIAGYLDQTMAALRTACHALPRS